MANIIWNFLNDVAGKKGISEISINGIRSVFIEKQGHFYQINAHFTAQDIKQFVDEVAKQNGKICDANHPIMDGVLPDGSRINVIYPPFVKDGPAISIRKYSPYIQTFSDDPSIFGLGSGWCDFFKACVGARMNLIISGGTGAGKTTFLNLLINEIHQTERIVTIEDTLELSLKQPNIVRLESGEKGDVTLAKLSTRDLVKNTLRMRPDRIIVGESRGGEIFDLFQAMNTGHEGSMTSIHANSSAECLTRMETLYLLAGFDVPLLAVRKMMTQAIHFIVQISRNQNGDRVISEIMELTGMEGHTITAHKIAEIQEGQLVATGIAPKCFDRLHRQGGLELEFFNNLSVS